MKESCLFYNIARATVFRGQTLTSAPSETAFSSIGMNAKSAMRAILLKVFSVVWGINLDSTPTLKKQKKRITCTG